jgi:hypothetical protein
MATLDEIRKKFQHIEEPGDEAPKRKPKKRLIEAMRGEGDKAKAAVEKPKVFVTAPEAKPAFTRPGGRFTPAVDKDGDPDAILQFSQKYKGCRVSEMAKAGEDVAGFLQWVLTKHREEKVSGGPGFKKELVRIIKIQLGKV